MLSIKVIQEAYDGMPNGWEIYEGEEKVGTVFDVGASNSVELNFIKPFRTQFLGAAIEGPEDYTQPFQSTQLEVDEERNALEILSEWVNCDMNYFLGGE